ncbi:YDG domain-containing protein [Rhodopirellula bahusiensis]|uniref:YDG domain-containing protein n=1 Tax=Rhodopirellula bahusiensis TaxID=2014065 RepID=UPI001E2EF735|nr:YDG domain-containing protein [Rhodopirellula bahusiensis]
MAGQAAISQAAGMMDVNATSSRTIVNWDSFNVGAGNVANFNLPNSSAAILNRVTTPDMPSTIAGAIHSNGNVMLVNPSGIMVNSSGMVNTNGFTASTFDVTNESFLNGGPLVFTNDGSDASIVNEGSIQTGSGGAHLIANEIANDGMIASDGGNITLSAGGTVTLDNGVTYVQASMDTLASGISPAAGLIQNTGTIRATGAASVGGEVYLVNPGGEILHDGTIESQLASGEQGGKVHLEADRITLQENSVVDATGSHGGGTVLVGGEWQGSGTMTQATSVAMETGATIDASATEDGDGGTIVLWSDVFNKDSVTRAFGNLIARAGQLSGSGGQIETSGAQVDTTGVRVDAGAPNGEGGDWLIDPYNFIIDLAASVTLVGALDSGTNVTVDTTVDLPLLGGLGSDLELGDITLTSDLITGAMSGDATLSLKAHQNIILDAGVTIDATQNSNANKLNVVLWADQDNSGTGTVRIGSGLVGTTIHTNGGGLAITGGSATTWTPSDGEPDIAIGSGRAMAGDLLGLLNGAEILNTDIDTDGGNVLIRAGSSGSLSIFDEVFGIELNGTSISTGSGSITLDGLVEDQLGLNVDNAVGVHLAGGSSLTSSTGDISITGELANTSEFVNGSGVWIGREIDNVLTASGDVSITTGDGDIDIIGIGADNSGSGWRHGLALMTSNGSDEINIATVGGNITLDGTATFRDGATSDSSGLQLQPGSAGALLVTSQTGDITLRGVNSQEAAADENAIRFAADNVAGDITIGYDGINPFSGDILIQANSISQHFTNAGNGSISIQGLGGLTIESVGSSFTKAMVFDDDWNFGATFGSMVFGKINNTANLTFNDPLTLAGGFSALGGELTLNDDLTSTSTGDLLFKSNLATNNSIQLLGDIYKTGGDRSILTAQADGRVQVVGSITSSGGALLDTILWSDYHNTGSGGTSILGNITTGGGHFWAGGSGSDGGSQDWNGLTVGDGASVGASGFNHNALDLFGDINSGGGDILLWAGLGFDTGIDGIGLSGTRLLNGGAGDITLIGDDFDGGTLNVDLYGHLRICPNDIWANIGSQLDFDGSVSANTFTGVNADIDWLVISNLNLLGGLSLGKAGLSQDIRLYDSLAIDGGLELFGRNITVESGATLDLSSAGSLGSLLVDASADVNINGAITLGGDLTITGGNDINLGGLIARVGSANTDITLKADRHIVLDGNIDTVAGSQNVQLWADADDSGDGINIFRAESLVTAGGNFTTGNGNVAELNGVNVQVGGDIYITNAAAQTFDTDGGDIAIQGETIIANASVAGVTFDSKGGDIDFSGLLNSGNQYDFVDGPDGAGSWDWARTDARNGTAGGSLLGESYLVTITSRLENAIAGIEAGYQGAWIGAYRDTATPLDWKWADGPESGQHFWTEVDAGGGSAEPGAFANFGPGEPNGGPSVAGESVGQLYGNSGLWNDLSSSTTFAATQTGDYDVLGYVRETNSAPAAVTIDAGTTGLVTMGGIGAGKALASLDVTSAGVTISGDSLITTGTQTYDSGFVATSTLDLNISSSGLSADGDIHLEGTTLTLASDLTANLAGDILLRTDSLSLPQAVSIDTTGELTIEPLNTSFAAPFTLPLETLTLSTNLTGLLVGKDGNTANITLDGDLIINGDAEMVGGDVTLLDNVNTNGGDFIARSTGAIVQSANVDVETDGGKVTYWSDSDADGVGHIDIQSGATISTEGGDLQIAGGLDSNFDQTPDGFASGQALVDDSGRFHSGVSLHNAILDTRIAGVLDGTAGDITLRGISTYTGADNASGVLLYASQLFGNQIDVLGSVTHTGGTTTRFGILADGGVSPNNTSLQAFGGLSLTGNAATVADQYSIFWGANHEMSVLDGDVNIDAAGQLRYLSTQSMSLAASRSLILNLDETSIWQSVITGEGGLIKQGSGTLSLQAANSFTGALQISGGTLTQNQSGAIHDAVAVTIDSGAAWDLAGFNETVTSFGGFGNITLGAGTLTAFGDNSSGALAGVISGSGNLVKQGSGELVLSGLNTYTGTTAVDGSLRLRTDQLSLSSTSYIGTGSVFLEPLNTSFSSALDTTGTTFGGSLAGLTIGKLGNTANITIGSSLSIQGDISLFGGDLNLHAGVNSNDNAIYLHAANDVTQNIAGTLLSRELELSGGGDFELNQLTNDVATIAASGVGDLHYVDSNAVEIGSVLADGITASGLVAVETLAGDLTVSQDVATTNTTVSAIVLNAGRDADAGTATGGNLIINSSPAITTGVAGQASLFTGSIDDSTGLTSLVGSGTGDFRYNSDESASNFSTPLTAGMQAIYREQPTATIVANDATTTYGVDAPTPTGSATGLVNGDAIGTLAIVSPTYSGASKLEAGSYDVTDASLTALGYNVVDDLDAITVDQKLLTPSGFAASTKVYDGTTDSALAASGVLTGIELGDLVTMSNTGASFSDKNVGTNKTVTVNGLALSGTDATNYSLGGVSTANTTGDITAKLISVSGLASSDKVYDGTTVATTPLAGAVFNGMVVGDDLSVTSITGTFNDKNVGTSKTVTLTDAVYGGADVGNYAISDQNTSSADITARSLTVNGISSGDKVYDGTTSAIIDLNGITFNGLISGDDLTASGTTGTFADKHAGTNKTVTLSGTTFGGSDVGNYAITDQSNAIADITAKAITVSGIAVGDKIYDGTTNGTVDLSGLTFNGLVGGDDLTGSGTVGTFADKNVGTAKSVALSGTTYGGSDVGNYAITDQVASTADITAKALSVSGITAGDKVYDGTTNATLDTSGIGFTGLVGGDDLSIASVTGTFTDKNAAANKTVNLTGSSYNGVDVGNYEITDQASALATISQKALTVSGISAADKVYDGTTNAALDLSGLTLFGLISGDEITTSGTSGAFTNKNVGTDKTVNITGTTFGGADAGNYAITDQSNAIADITAKAITVSGIAVGDKVYDGTTTGTVDLSGLTFNGLVGGDDLTGSGTVGTFADKNVGTAKSVALSGTTYGGSDVGNYAITDQATAAADITAKALTISGITAGDKVYDGTTNATLDTSGITFTGLVGGDELSIATVTGTFTDKNAAANKTVNLTGSSYNGVDVGNYAITDQASALATISQKALTVSGIAAADKVYDGTTNAALDLSGLTLFGLISGDEITTSGTSGAFTNKNVGTDKTVNITGTTFGGADAGNYAITDQSNAIADITAKAITVSGIAVGDKVYDGTTNGTVDLSGLTFNGLVGGDDLTGSGTVGTFADKNAGTAKSVALSGTTYGGSDVGNYAITDQATAAADITAKALSVSGITAGDKVYDGTTNATLDTSGISFTGLVGGDDLSIASVTGTFTDKNAAANKTVNLTGSSYNGVDVGNYAITDQASALATISQKGLTVSGIAAADKIYDGATSAVLDVSGAAFAGMIGGDDLSIASAAGSFADKNAGTAKQVAISGVNYGGVDVGNYSFVDQAFTTASITPLAISVSGITAANRVYDSETDTAVDTSGLSFDGMIAGDNLTASGTIGNFVNKHVGTGKSVLLTDTIYGGTDVGNYLITDQASATANITPLSVLLTGLTGSDKTYDATTLAILNGSAAVTTLTGDDVTLSGTAIGNYASKDAGADIAIGVSGLHLQGLDSNNYELQSPVGLTGSISAAPLTVRANHDAKFVGNADSATFAGVNIIGFVGGETASDLSGSLAVSRTGVGVDESAGDYSGVLTPSGYASGNYDISYEAGDFKIVPAEELLVRFGNSESVYGDSDNFSFLSAQYMDGGNVIHDLAAPNQNGNTYTFDDGAGGTAELTIAAGTASFGAGGALTVGSYDLIASSVSETSANFSDQISVMGSHSVAAAPLNTTLSNASKVYDGTVAFDLSGMSLTGNVSGDSLSLSGIGEYLTKNAGTGLSYTIDGLTLSGDDASNYFLASGSSLSGTDGIITAKNISLTAPAGTKTYDGNTSLTPTQDQLSALSGQLGVAGDFVDWVTLDFNNKNVGTGKTLAISNATILDGNSGANYNLTYNANSGATIERLDSVQWVGGTAGDWSDPNNWAGGAIPDLNNVANVILPAGVSPTFDNSVGGPVDVDSITGDNLLVNSGTLRIRENAELEQLAQTGGQLQLDGNLATDILDQQGGTLNLGGTLSVLRDFTQTIGSVIDAVGNVDVTQTTGDLNIHNLSGNHVDLTSTTGNVHVGALSASNGLDIIANNGGIEQLAGSALIVDGATTLDANALVTLDEAGNDFRGSVSVNALAVTLQDGVGGLELGNVQSIVDFIAQSFGGVISQIAGGRIEAGGLTNVVAESAGTAADVILDNVANDFQGIVQATGRDIRITDNSGDLNLGQLLAGGELDVVTSGGAILQDASTTIESVGEASFTARSVGLPADILLANANNQFRDIVNVDGRTIDVSDIDGQVDFGRYRSVEQTDIIQESLSQNVRDTNTRYLDEATEQTTKSTLGRVWTSVREFVNRVFADAEVPGGRTGQLTINEVTQSGGEVYVHQGREEPINPEDVLDE